MTYNTLITEKCLLTCQVLVVGSGAGGASAASVLSSAGIDVLILDEGSYLPAKIVPSSFSSSILEMWRGGGLMSTLGSQIAFAEGKCVGGGTEINSAIFQRAPDAILQEWQSANKILDFSLDSLKSYYDKAAKAVNASVSEDVVGRPTEIIAAAGKIMNWKVDILERGQKNCVATNSCSSGCPTGAKQSMTATLIPKSINSGARLISKIRVYKLIKKGRKIERVLALAEDLQGKKHKVEIIADTIFLCAGTMQTPLLLKKSRIGQGFGETFQLHPTVRLLARFNAPVNANNNRLPLAAITEFMPDMRFGGSVFSLPTFGMALAEDWKNRSDLIQDYKNYAIYYAMIKPDGVGKINVIPGMNDPIVTYKLTNRDYYRLKDGARLMAKALLKTGATMVIPSVRNHLGWDKPDSVDRYQSDWKNKDMSIMTIHLFSSCPMGEDESCPVDSYGNLKALDNVVIADGSVLPTAPGVNPQATIMALAFRAADSYLGRSVDEKGV